MMKEQQRRKQSFFLESKEQQDKEKIHKQQILQRKQNEMNATVTKRSDEINIMYTNIDGIISRKLELEDYLKEKKPQIVFLTQTKLCEEIQTNIENGNYNIWRKDRKDKKGGGVMLMIKSKIKVINVEYGKGKRALISAQMNTRCAESQTIIVAYVAPKTKTWTKEEHEEIEDTLDKRKR